MSITPAIMGGVLYFVVRDPAWLRVFVALGILALALARPNVEQFREFIPKVGG